MEEFPKPKPKVEKEPEGSIEERFESSRTKLWEMVDRGASEQERMDIVKAWYGKEVEINEAEKLKPENKGVSRTLKEDFDFMVRVAEVKYAGGFFDESWEDFQDALNAAVEAKRDDIADKIRARIRELQSQ